MLSLVFVDHFPPGQRQPCESIVLGQLATLSR